MRKSKSNCIIAPQYAKMFAALLQAAGAYVYSVCYEHSPSAAAIWVLALTLLTNAADAPGRRSRLALF